MAVHLHGQDTARSIPWGSRSPLVKTQSGESGQDTRGIFPDYEGQKLDVTCRDRRVVRIGSWNVGSMSGKAGEVADVLNRRKVMVCCVQETRWKGGSARWIGGGMYKFFWVGCERGDAGVGVIGERSLAEKVLEVRRVSERLIMLKLVMYGRIWRIISAYAPQVGKEDVEKERFWEMMEHEVGRSEWTYW